jgi:hypothetical protein
MSTNDKHLSLYYCLLGYNIMYSGRYLVTFLNVKFAVQQATKDQVESRGIALLFFNLGARWGCVINATPRPQYVRERDPVPIVQEAGWAPEPVRTGAENLAPTGIRSPDRPARSESLYRLRYPDHLLTF